jgi:16S rRNA (cytosine967-C5)-methyltransferase
MPIFARLERANVRNVQVRAPKGQMDVLADRRGACDLVLVDAPCTGTGAWRRNPDAKWRLRETTLEQRIKEQNELIEEAQAFVKPGGRLFYVTCSVLREENEDRIAAFLASHPDFQSLEAACIAKDAMLPHIETFASRFGPGFRFSPFSSGTDGFYVAGLVRS